ncbi:MAG: hypothetical protein HDQ98_08225 [Lachnospiraceae bacterium]|nr:hypothetical protein [Lachnospiraceae bacterium]
MKNKKLQKRAKRPSHSVEAYAACGCYCACICGCGCRGIFSNRFRNDIPSRVSSLMRSGALNGNANEISR